MPTLSSILTKFALSGILGVGEWEVKRGWGWKLMIFCARATRGLGGPRWTRAMEDPSAPIPEETGASLEGTCISFDARRKEARTKGRGIHLHVFVIMLLCRVERLCRLLLVCVAADGVLRVHGCADLVR